MPVLPGQQPTQAKFIDTFVPAPFEEVLTLGRAIGAKKSSQMDIARGIKDDLFEIPAAPEHREFRNERIQSYKDDVKATMKLPLMERDAKLAEILDRAEYDIRYGDLSFVSADHGNWIANKKAEMTARKAEGGKLWADNYSDTFAKESYNQTFLPQGKLETLDPEGRPKIRELENYLLHNDEAKYLNNVLFTSAIQKNLIEWTSTDEDNGTVTTSKEEGVTDKRIFTLAYKFAEAGNLSPNIEQQYQIKIASEQSKDPGKVRKEAIKTIKNIDFGESLDPEEVIEALTPQDERFYAMVGRMSNVGHNRVHWRSTIKRKPISGKKALEWSLSGNTLRTGDFTFTHSITKKKAVAGFPVKTGEEVDEYEEFLISKAGKGGTTANQPMLITDPKNPKEQTKIVPLSFRKKIGSDEWGLYGRMNVTKIVEGKREEVLENVLLPYDDIKEAFANNYSGITLERVLREYEERKQEGSVILGGGATTPTQQKAASKYVTGQTYKNKGKLYKWDGSKFIPE